MRDLIEVPENGGLDRSPGYDAGKKIGSKKQQILVDTPGSMLRALVHGTDIQDRNGRDLGEAISSGFVLRKNAADARNPTRRSGFLTTESELYLSKARQCPSDGESISTIDIPDVAAKEAYLQPFMPPGHRLFI